MFSFLGNLFVLLLMRLWDLPKRIVEGFDQAVDGLFRSFFLQRNGTDELSQQTIVAVRSSAGPPRDWWTCLLSFVLPKPLARVRVPSRRSIR